MCPSTAAPPCCSSSGCWRGWRSMPRTGRRCSGSFSYCPQSLPMRRRACVTRKSRSAENDPTGDAMETYVLRLSPGDDVRESLERSVPERRVAAGWVLACVGSLARATLRYAGHRRGTIVSDPLEIVALSGTLSPDGVHLHMACADAEGRAIDARTGHSELIVEETEFARRAQ